MIIRIPKFLGRARETFFSKKVSRIPLPAKHFPFPAHLIKKAPGWTQTEANALVKRKAFPTLVIALMLWCVTASAQPDFARQDGHITGSFTTKDGVMVRVDMPVPEDFPQPLLQVRLLQQPISKIAADRALRAYALDTGVLSLQNTSIAGQSLYFMQPDYRHQGSDMFESSAAHFPAGNDPQHLQAQETVKGFLDVLGVSGYEYPFYSCRYDYQIDGSDFHPFASQEDYIRAYSFAAPPSLPNIEDYPAFLDAALRRRLSELETLGRPATEVIVRFLVHGLPIHTMNSWSPGQSGITGDGNPTPFARFVVTREGKIAFAYIRFWFAQDSQQPDSHPLLPWQDILTQSLTISWEEYHSPDTQADKQLTVRAIEPLLSVDGDGMTFPIWKVILEEDDLDKRRFFPGFPDSFYRTDYTFTYDANTGAPR